MKKKFFILAALFACVVASVASAAPQTSATMSGTLTSNDGKFFLMDQATHSTVEVRGEGLTKYVGKNVSLTGQLTSDAPGSQDVLLISSINRKAVAVPGSKAAAAGVKGGLSKGAIFGLAGAGAAAGTVGGLYGAGVFSDDSPVSPN